MQTGELIRQARMKAGLTQEELASRLGVTPQAISQYERGVKNPKLETIKKIADALNLPWIDLYTDDTSQSAAMKSVMVSIDEFQKAFEKLKKGYLETDLNIATAKELAYRADLLKQFEALNEMGQSVAVERVHELAQIPKYQRAQETPQGAPAGPDDKTPAEK